MPKVSARYFFAPHDKRAVSGYENKPTAVGFFRTKKRLGMARLLAVHTASASFDLVLLILMVRRQKFGHTTCIIEIPDKDLKHSLYCR